MTHSHAGSERAAWRRLGPDAEEASLAFRPEAPVPFARGDAITVRAVKVVLLHALPLDATMWHQVAEGLQYEVVAPDLYQLGPTLQDWAQGVLDLVGRGPLAVVGNSVGGSCAIEVARLAPGAVRHLILIGAKPGHRPDPAYRDAAVRLLETAGIEAAWSRYWAPLVGPTAPADVAESIRRIALAQSIEDLVRGVRVFHGRTDRSAFLSSWTGPVTVVSGEHDLAPAQSKELAASLKQGQFSLVSGSGHYAPIEAAPRVCKIVRDSIA